MKSESKIVHGFYLHLSKGEGKPSIFLYPVFPAHIVDIRPIEPSGSSILLKSPDDKTTTVSVTESAEEIKAMISKCKNLDEQIVNDPEGANLK